MNHDSYSDDYIADILGAARVFAFVGASANTSRPSYFAMKYLLGKGYGVIPVNPGLAGQELLGQKVYASLAEVPGPVDVVDIFRSSDAALGHRARGHCAQGQARAHDHLDAARREERRGGGRSRGGRPQGRHEPLRQDRVRAVVGRDRLGRRQLGQDLEFCGRSSPPAACRATSSPASASSSLILRKPRRSPVAVPMPSPLQGRRSRLWPVRPRTAARPAGEYRRTCRRWPARW